MTVEDRTENLSLGPSVHRFAVVCHHNTARNPALDQDLLGGGWRSSWKRQMCETPAADAACSLEPLAPTYHSSVAKTI